MVGNSKVLTVSYGTFSCTLEGFDDSFDTMKAIAEYFRDLAAEDRYFGAEPPQPDADVLARIAQRELSRGVEARTEGNAVLLKPTEAKATEEAPVEVAPVEEPAPEAVSAPLEDQGGDETLVSEAAQAELEVENDDAPAAEADDDEQTLETAVAEEELAAAAVIQDVPADEAMAELEEQAEDYTAEELKEETKDAAFFDVADEDDESSEEAIILEDADYEDVVDNDPAAFFEQTVVDTALDAPSDEPVAEADEPQAEAVEPEVEEKPADNSLAAKLRRIQAVVGAASAGAAARAAGKSSSVYTEDEHAEDYSHGAETEAKAEGSTPANDEFDAVEATSDFNNESPRILKVRRAAFEAAMANAQAEQAEGQLENETSEDEEEDTSVFVEADVAVAEDESDLETTLSPEDEAELEAELAAVEAEATEADSDDAEDEELDAQVEEEPTKPSFEDSDAAMSRLMDETDAKLDEPENKTRREAYSHLKAAVAAKQASRDMGEEEGETADKREGDYRADLAKVVRPRRAAKSDKSELTERPAPAPLKLVASQRVDQPQDTEAMPSEPVRPRRVAQQPEAADANLNAFASFASSAGADDLSDVMEAAASYVTHVQGQEVFSRPQVMRVVQQALPQGSFSREDGLRAFGTLLRQGRLSKLRGGQFQITESTGFQPEARELRAAG